MTLGDRIRERRKAAGLTQQKIANAINMTVQHISAVESGRRAPSLQVLTALAQKLNVSTDYLITGREVSPIDAIRAIRADEELDIDVRNALTVIVHALRSSQGPHS